MQGFNDTYNPNQ
jgi:hypothetical protein